MCEFCGFVEEMVLHLQTLEGVQRMGDLPGVRVGLGDVLALYVEPLEAASDGRVEHVRDTQAGIVRKWNAPARLEQLAGGDVRNVAIPGQFMREGSHVARALHVVLAA